MFPRGSEAITPTAHYTGYVWARNGLSHPRLQTTEGRLMYELVRGPLLVSAALGGPSLEPYLLARHTAIDARLTAAIESGAVGQVVELACGLSPRGWRFAERYGAELTYIETDLPAMAARKRRALQEIGALDNHHRVRELDALAPDGAQSLTELAGELDPDLGVAIITEGLISYLDQPAVIALWRRIARELHGFPTGHYYSDLHLGERQAAYARVFRSLLAGFVRGGVYLHFDSAAEGEGALLSVGFDAAEVQRAGARDGGRGHGGELVHIIEASTSHSR